MSDWRETVHRGGLGQRPFGSRGGRLDVEKTQRGIRLRWNHGGSLTTLPLGWLVLAVLPVLVLIAVAPWLGVTLAVVLVTALSWYWGTTDWMHVRTASIEIRRGQLARPVKLRRTTRGVRLVGALGEARTFARFGTTEERDALETELRAWLPELAAEPVVAAPADTSDRLRLPLHRTSEGLWLALLPLLLLVFIILRLLTLQGDSEHDWFLSLAPMFLMVFALHLLPRLTRWWFGTKPIGELELSPVGWRQRHRGGPWTPWQSWPFEHAGGAWHHHARNASNWRPHVAEHEVLLGDRRVMLRTRTLGEEQALREWLSERGLDVEGALAAPRSIGERGWHLVTSWEEDQPVLDWNAPGGRGTLLMVIVFSVAWAALAWWDAIALLALPILLGVVLLPSVLRVQGVLVGEKHLLVRWPWSIERRLLRPVVLERDLRRLSVVGANGRRQRLAVLARSDELDAIEAELLRVLPELVSEGPAT
ncbi:MAG: hypothetical protein AAF533_00370 [Acidobacteriota bacterium]